MGWAFSPIFAPTESYLHILMPFPHRITDLSGKLASKFANLREKSQEKYVLYENSNWSILVREAGWELC